MQYVAALRGGKQKLECNGNRWMFSFCLPVFFSRASGNLTRSLWVATCRLSALIPLVISARMYCTAWNTVPGRECSGCRRLTAICPTASCTSQAMSETLSSSTLPTSLLFACCVCGREPNLVRQINIRSHRDDRTAAAKPH